MTHEATATRTLILLRHGESTANAGDSFGGWLDPPLTQRGRRQAATAGATLQSRGLAPQAVHTSMLTRAIDTAAITVARAGGTDSPMLHTWRLNERHYGQLQGRSRASVRSEYGEALFWAWRRSCDIAPPAVELDDPRHPRHDPRYAAVPQHELPATESLVDVHRRVMPYWRDSIVADLSRRRVVLVVTHGNTLRALCMHLDSLTPDEVRSLTMPTGVPLLYELDHSLTPVHRGGVYLEPGRQCAPRTDA